MGRVRPAIRRKIGGAGGFEAKLVECRALRRACEPGYPTAMKFREAIDAFLARLRKPVYWMFVFGPPVLLFPTLFLVPWRGVLRGTLQALVLMGVWALAVFFAALPWQWVSERRSWRAWVRGILQSLALAALLAALGSLLVLAFSGKSGAFVARWLDVTSGIWGFLIVLMPPMGLVVARLEGADSEAKAARAKAKEAQWMSHRGAFSPHLLFRNLNYLADRAEQTTATEDGLLELAALYRQWLIEAEKPLIPFASERELTERYLALEGKPWGGSLRVRWILESALDARPVPPLLFLPLLESALGGGPGKGALFLEVGASSEGADLVLALRARGAVALPEAQPLAQIQQRLRAVFDSGGEVSVSPVSGGWNAIIRVPSLNPGDHA